jgi:hypothetical protein
VVVHGGSVGGVHYAGSDAARLGPHEAAETVVVKEIRLRRLLSCEPPITSRLGVAIGDVA